MSFNLEALELAETYDFGVVVNDGANNFAAKLNLSPEKITITIMGEGGDERNCSLGYCDVDSLICRDLNNTFFLHELTFVKGSSRLISHHPKHIGFFESTFEVGYVIFSPSHLDENNLVESISIHSNKISEWVGTTNTQEEIIRAYNDKEPILECPEKLNEFLTPLDGVGILGVGYNLSMHSSSPRFSAGISFPPSLTIVFLNGQISKIVMDSFRKLYALLAFFMGDDFLVEQVDISFGSSFRSRKGTLYYPSKGLCPRYEQGYSLFPLGLNVRFDSLGLPALPVTSFNNYYSLPEVYSGYFSKYLKYKRMENPEERFLGFFRILESLCFNKKSYLDEELLGQMCDRVKPYLIKKFGDKENATSFLRGIPRYNNSKYNTEKCIQDFYSRIPKLVSGKWKVEKRDIGSICKLRNDITHANDYYINNNEIEEKVKFMEVLLVYSLFEKLGVELTTTAEIAYRMQGYHLVTKKP
ncbi:ApeA N-terminal domain 1-containing protein [Desulfotalea psychrophila]|uniref:ApeA N-terminal domain-containing protein n=1 Tax=Desulfotalea psychrophila (strain LSv54 / DSM 12343) TaxID=177439 RepID=Q6AP24_DESPS|nr:HEPN domain-containing protein [Desulfotalea psychrophila]CAG35900.1 unknown protein [Desulfotalea psychrophila LSv54]